MRILVLSLCVLTMTSEAVNKYKIKRPTPSKELIEKLYREVSGFVIDAVETREITEKGGNATYGEITYESLRELFELIKPTEKDVFYDLGCGVGKACVQAVIDTPVKKAVGVEISQTRVSSAQRVQKELHQDGVLPKEKELAFKRENITDADLSDATIVYMCSTCFSPELMQKLTNKLVKLPHNVRVATLKKLPEEHNFKMVKELNASMSWSTSTPLYLYELKK